MCSTQNKTFVSEASYKQNQKYIIFIAFSSKNSLL